MGDIKDLNCVGKTEFLNFLNSFDFVFSDVDGVLVLTHDLIPGSDQCLENFKKLGKKVVYITNNAVETAEQTVEKLKAFKAQDKDIFNPLKGVINYLKTSNFDKSQSLYVIGSPSFKNGLQNSGYQLIDFEPETVPENLIVIRDICLEAIAASPKVGAVILDFDFNFTLVKGVRATVLLRAKPDLVFLSGLRDYVLVMGDGIRVAGSGFYIDSIERVAKKKSIVLGKPGAQFGEIVNQAYGVTDPNRVLFIGDSIQTDMMFATKCGYQKLLVLTGSTLEENIKQWPASEDIKPQYYVRSLDDVNKLLLKFDLIPENHEE